ncbi:hypothetical protein H4S02_006181 [Coemansia sp. RSA 2611]|nr:hypothetical protein H4S02_006181 [Coemansia sp. RSA 2611]
MQPFLMHSRGYHDSAEYGCISPPRVKAEAYSAEELRNRQANAGLLQLLSAGMYGLGEDSGVFDIKGKYCFCVAANASATSHL